VAATRKSKLTSSFPNSVVTFNTEPVTEVALPEMILMPGVGVVSI